MTRVLAISDLHVNYRENWSAIRELPACPDDWLVLAGDIGERIDHLPRFALWCGTTLTEDWHTRYSVEAVVYGHLHRRTTTWKQGIRFEEVSLGKPSEWERERGATAYVRQILPCITPPNLDVRHS